MSVTLTRGYAPIEQYSYKSKRWPATDIYLDRAIQLKPNYAEAHHNKGWVLLNTKNSNNEVENIRELLLAYRQATKFYPQQHKPNLSKTITQAFQMIEVEL